MTQSGFFDNDKKLEDYTEEEMERLLYSPPVKVKTEFGGKTVNITFEGIIDKFTRKYITRDVKTYSERTQKQVEPYITIGGRFSSKVRANTWGKLWLKDM